MLKRLTQRIAVIAGAALMMAGTASADTWNDLTKLTFSEPVMIPGATLQPGTYEFKLLDINSPRHMVQIVRADGEKAIAVLQAVPMKRSDPNADIVLQFDPTEPGTPPALRGWFHPGSLYGHEFVYPEEQAREIANRTKTVVLSLDHPGTDLESGRLVTFDERGVRQDWKGDETTLKEWDAWRSERDAKKDETPMAAREVDRQETTPEERRDATAPAISSEFAGMRVKLDDIEDEPMKFVGKTISVDAEVQKVYGPRLFTIDEPNWMDFDGEVLVHAPNALAALVREGDRLTVTGTVKGFAAGDVKDEWGWVGLDPDDPDEYRDKALIEASRIVGGDSNLALLISADDAPGRTEGQRDATEPTPRGAIDGPITSAEDVATGGHDLIGRHVTLEDVRVDELADTHGGFYLKSGSDVLFVLPSQGVSADVKGGDAITVEGVVLRAPRNMALEGDLPRDTNEDIYVLATAVRH